jgi:hypothetical protein
MENGPFTDDFPIKISIYNGFSMAMLNNQRVFIYIYIYEFIDLRCSTMDFRLHGFRDISGLNHVAGGQHWVHS